MTLSSYAARMFASDCVVSASESIQAKTNTVSLTGQKRWWQNVRIFQSRNALVWLKQWSPKVNSTMKEGIKYHALYFNHFIVDNEITPIQFSVRYKFSQSFELQSLLGRDIGISTDFCNGDGCWTFRGAVTVSTPSLDNDEVTLLPS